MTDNGKARPLAAIVGERLKVLREQRQLRQSDLAEAAAKAGLNWSRSSIAALEAGTRNLSIEEFILLPLVISNAGGWHEPFLPPESLVLLSRHSHVRADQIANSFESLTLGAIVQRPEATVVEVEEEDEARDELEEELAELGAIGRDRSAEFELQHVQHEALEAAIARVLYDIYPHVDMKRVGKAKYNYDLMAKVARRISVPPSKMPARDYIQPLSFALWSRPFEEERDARAAERGPYPSPRSEQAARGHVTRDMIAEIDEAVREIQPMLKPLLDEVERVWDSEEDLYKWHWKMLHEVGRTSINEVHLETLPVIGSILRAAREDAGMSVDDLAEKTRTTRSTIEALEKGRPHLNFPLDVVEMLISTASEAVGVNPSVALARLVTPLNEEFRPDLKEKKSSTHRKPSRWRRA